MANRGSGRLPDPTMTQTIEIDDDLMARLEALAEEDETVEEVIEELVNVYESEGAFLREGYSE